MAQSTTTHDERSKFEDSDADHRTTAAVAQRLRESDVFHSMMASAARRSIEAHLVSSDDFDTATIDAAAVDTLAETVADTSTNGLYLLRNYLVTAEQANVHEGDRIHMESARDGETIITYRVISADPDATDVEATHVDRDADRGRRATVSFGAGQILFSDRFEVEHTAERSTTAAVAGGEY